jgi:phosphatidylglycerol:prolipoprotein diacylglycerol transferase
LQPDLEIGPLELKTFGLCFAAGFIVAAAVLARHLKELGKPVDWAYEVIFAGLVGGVIGSRVDYLLQNWDEVSDDFFGNLFSGSGLVWFGGLVGGAVGVVLWAWRRGFLGLQLLDVCAVPLALGYAVGRLGCQLSGDGDYGVASSLPWAMAYPDGEVPTTEEVHPTPIYETLAVGAIAYALWRLRDALTVGMLFALYLVLTGIERLLIEFIRRNDEVLLGLTQPQVISVLMILAGGSWIGVRMRRGDFWAPSAPGDSAVQRA